MNVPEIIAKPWGAQWGVYNVDTASWPVTVPGFGKVGGPFNTQQEALDAAENLGLFYAETS